MESALKPKAEHNRQAEAAPAPLPAAPDSPTSESGAGAGLPLFMQRGPLPAVPPGDAAAEGQARQVGDAVGRGETPRGPAGAAPGIAPSSGLLSSAGQPLPLPTRAYFASALGRSFDEVRVHTGRGAAIGARALNARAFTAGRDVVMGAGQYAPETPAGRGLLAHELTHVAQQAAAPGRPALQRNVDPTTQSLTQADIQPLSEADLREAIGVAQKALAGAGLEAPTSSAIWNNLDLMVRDLQRRNLRMESVTGPRQAASAAEQADPRQIAALDRHYEVVDLLASRQLATEAPDLHTRIEERRKLVQNIHRDAVLDEGQQVQDLEIAIESLIQTKAVVPAQPAADPNLSTQDQNFRRALRLAGLALLTPAQADALAGMEVARSDYFTGFARVLLLSAEQLKAELPKARDIPDVSNYEEGLFTRTPGGPWEGPWDLRTYRESLDRLTLALNAYGNLTARAAGTPAERMAFLVESGDKLMDQIGQVQALMVSGRGIALVSYFQTKISSEERFGDAERINEMRNDMIEPMIAGLRMERSPKPEAIEKAQYEYDIAAPLPQEEEPKRQQEERINEYRKRHPLATDPSSSLTRRRLEGIAEFERRFGIFLGITASILTMVAASAAVAKVMQTSVFAEGGALAAGQGWRIGLARFAVQSLTFTAASQVMQSALYHRLPTPWEVTKAAGMDALTLGFMHFIGLPFGTPGEVPAGVQFGALWAWSAGWQLGIQAYQGDLTWSSAAKTVALTGVETALTLRALKIAQQVGVLPTPDLGGRLFRTRTVEQNAAMSAYLEAQRTGREIGRDAQAWAAGEQRPEVLDDILQRSDGFLGRYRRAMEQMRDSGLIPADEVGKLLDQSVAHVAQVRNVRDAMRLGLEMAGPQMVRYTGDPVNLDLYLRRLQREGTITRFTPAGRGGIYEVTYPDGATRYFYPEAAEAGPLPQADFLAEALERAVPNIAGPVRADMLAVLRRLPLDVAGRIVLAAQGSPNATTVLAFLTRPEVALEAARPGSLYDPAFLEAALAGDAGALQILNHPEQPIVLQRWFQTAFEGVAGGRSLGQFLSFLEEVRLYHGSLAVESLGEARYITQQMAAAFQTVPYSPDRPAPAVEPDVMSAPGAYRPRTGPALPTGPDAFFQRHGYSGNMRETTINNIRTVMQFSADGRPQRAWFFVANASEPGLEVDVQAALRELEAGVRRAEELGRTDPAAARAALEALKPHLDALYFLRRLRGIDLSRELALLDRAQYDPLGPNARPAVPAADLPAPAAAPEAAVELAPVTPREILAARQQTLLETAARMGRLADPAVREAASLRPRLYTGREALDEARRRIEAAEHHLDDLARETYAGVQARLGEARFKHLLDTVFAGRDPVEVGRMLRYMLDRPAFSETMLDALVRLPAQHLPVLRQLDPAVLSAIGEVAARSPEAAARLLEQSDLLLELQRSPDAAARFVALADLTSGSGMVFADPHRHVFGGIPHPELLVQGMQAAALVDVTGLSAAEATAARLAALDAAFNRAQLSGDRFLEALGQALPPDHPGAQAIADRWRATQPVLARFRDVLADSIRNQESTPEADTLAAEVTDQLNGVFTLPIESATTGPQADLFFPLFREIAQSAREAPPPASALRTATAVAAEQRVALVEFRGGLSRDVRRNLNAQLEQQHALGPDGNVLPSVRIVISVPRGRFDVVQVMRQLEGLGPLRERVVGFDVSGVESRPLEAGQVQALTGGVAYLNYSELTTMFNAHPELLTQVTERLGANPVDTGLALVDQITAPGPRPSGPNVVDPGAELARLNRRVREIVAELDAREGIQRLPRELLGVTIHAGEQLAGEPRLADLLNDIQVALDAGVDRIGHGAILGIPLPAGLAELGFVQQADGSWSRPRPGGAAETYTPGQLAAMETQRIRLIRRAGDESVTLEVNPTSNISLSGLAPGSHPLGEILRVRPNLRVAIATDNPSIHMTDPAQELALAAAVSGATFPQTIRFYLEGYATRLGGRPLTDAAALRAQVHDSIVVATPPGERGYVLNELNERYGIGEPVSYAGELDAATFSALLAPYVNLVIQ